MMQLRLDWIAAAAMTAASALAFGVSGCAVHAHPEPVGYVELTSAPIDVEAYPSTVYDGHTVYLYNDRWYYRDGGRWAYYRHEPRELYLRRGYVQRPYVAPAPYVRQRPYVQQAPPARGPVIHRGPRDGRGRQSAPPAVPVR
jgi:hypothetical protein